MILLQRDIIHSPEEIIQRSTYLISDVGAAQKVFPHWLKKKKNNNMSLFSLFPIVSRLGYRTNWLLGLGELLHDPF